MCPVLQAFYNYSRKSVIGLNFDYLTVCEWESMCVCLCVCACVCVGGWEGGCVCVACVRMTEGAWLSPCERAWQIRWGALQPLRHAPWTNSVPWYILARVKTSNVCRFCMHSTISQGFLDTWCTILRSTGRRRCKLNTRIDTVRHCWSTVHVDCGRKWLKFWSGRFDGIFSPRFHCLHFCIHNVSCVLFLNFIFGWIVLLPGDSSTNPVQLNDVVFTMHAVLLTVVTISQCFIYDRGTQKISTLCKVLVGAVNSVVDASVYARLFIVDHSVYVIALSIHRNASVYSMSVDWY